MNSSQLARDSRVATTGMLAACAATTMFFAAVGSAYIVRRGISNDWVALSLPGPFFLSIFPGAAVSIALEIARRRNSRLWTLGAIGFAFGFFYLMHAYAWRPIVHENSSPAGGFFFVIDGAFTLYTIGGIIALLVALRTLRLSVTALYWHYLNALWVLLLALFYLRP